MNGAEALLRTLLAGGVDVCFANPGTSEMHFVAALDRVESMRCVLTLFEGVATGAADGYGRMTGRPACTLLHLGPGLANGLSNLHNAGRAQSPVVNIVGDHATYHRTYDSPLKSDVEGTARPFSHWARTSPDAAAIIGDAVAAIAASRRWPAHIATLILPADTAWSTLPSTPDLDAWPKPAAALPRAPEAADIKVAAALLRSDPNTALLLSGAALGERGTWLAGQIAKVTGARIMAQSNCGRLTKGAGRVHVERVPTPYAQSLAALQNLSTMILVGASPPTANFAYPGRPSLLTPPGIRSLTLAGLDQDGVSALELLAGELGAGDARPDVAEFRPPGFPGGSITPDKLALFLATCLPENAIVVDESVTTGRGFAQSTQSARPHDWLPQSGGSIGNCTSLALGAAIACPDRKVICLASDGCGLYMPQAFWSQAREKLDIVTLVFANRRYAILQGEMANVGVADVGPNATKLLSLSDPDIGWVGLARSFGVEGWRVETMEDLDVKFAAALAQRGPHMIEVVL